MEELLAVQYIARLCHACGFGKGGGELGAAFAAEHSSDSKTQGNGFAVLSHDGAMLLLPWAEDNCLLPLTKCKPSHVGSSSKLQIAELSDSKDREIEA